MPTADKDYDRHPITPFRFDRDTLSDIDLIKQYHQLPSRAETVRMTVAAAAKKIRKKLSEKT